MTSPLHTAKQKQITCDHCGDDCSALLIQSENHSFCCNGCKTVYEILQAHNLNTYYDLESKPGIKLDSPSHAVRFDHLDDAEHRKAYVEFEDDAFMKVVFSVPQIHCASCIWLLENLGQLHRGIVHSSVNFGSKVAHITFRHQDLSMRELAELLQSIGYAPELISEDRTNTPRASKTLIIKIGIAGFCFGNIMLLAFPEYFGMDKSFSGFAKFFGYISLGLSLPVILYAGTDYFKNAFYGIKQRYINMDLPIAIGMLVLFIRSSFEVISGTGGGYFDSLSGLVFFLLIGKWFQQKTYDALAFDRDYTSYFPIVVRRIKAGESENIKIESLELGDKLEIRNGELIPADAILLEGAALIDYSFVTGESLPQNKEVGELIYAGGRQVGTKIVLQTKKEVNNSYLTRLWNQELFQKNPEAADLGSLSNKVSKYFTLTVLVITLGTALYWQLNDPSVIWNAVTAVLIVACPCALALSIPFSLGNATRLMGKYGLYVKSAESIEKLAKIQTVVLDKTGTMTHRGNMTIEFVGEALSLREKNLVKSAAVHSIHPLSMAISEHLHGSSELSTNDFEENPGLGIAAEVCEVTIRLGSWQFIGVEPDPAGVSCVHLEIDGKYRGYFEFKQRFRPGLSEMLNRLQSVYSVRILSGDQHASERYLKDTFHIEHAAFNQSPHDKLEQIQILQNEGKSVLMVGDGLNDAGALKQSDFGIAVSDNVHQFSPACDAILDAGKFELLPHYLRFAKSSVGIIYLSFLFSFLYNIVGLWFAVQGDLSPIIAAILMPLSSISIVAFSTIATNVAANIRLKN